MNSGKKTLGSRNRSIEALDQLGEGIADLCLLLELALEMGKDGGIEQAGLGVYHDGREATRKERFN